jgi:hypothetical protein
MSWWKQPARHALAARGIQTRVGRAQLDLAESGNRPSGTFLRGASYERFAQSLAKQYSEGSEVSPEDYEKAISPLFEALSSADLLVDRGELKAALRQLDLAEREYSSLCSHANLMNDSDAQEFTTAARMIGQKAITRCRVPVPAKAQTVVVERLQPATSERKVPEKPRVHENELQSR